MSRRFVSLKSTPISLGAGDELPAEIVVFPWGVRQTRYGRVALTERSVATVPVNQAARKFDTVALDFAHNTVEGTAAYKGEPAKIAANCTLSIVPGRGAVFTPINWTPEGREFVLGGHYKDLSIAAELDAEGNIIFVHSAGLCRQGEVVDCHLFTAFNAVMDPIKNPKTPEELSAFLLAALGLPPETSPEDMIQALLSKLNLKDKMVTEVELSAKFAALSADMSKQIADLKSSHANTERAAILNAAAAAGKVVPKMAEKLSVPDLLALCAELPVTVPLERRTPSHVALSAPGGDAPAYDPEMGARLGISKEMFEKFSTHV